MNSMGVRHNTRATPLLSLLWPPHVSAQSICDQAVIKLPRTTYEPVSGCASEMPPHKADSASQRAPVGDSDALLFRRIIASLKSELYVVSGHIVYPACIKLYGSQPLSSSFAALPSTPDSIFSPICASTNSDYKAPNCLSCSSRSIATMSLTSTSMSTSVDLSHHFSTEARLRQPNPMKAIWKLTRRKPNMVSLANGLWIRSPSLFAALIRCISTTLQAILTSPSTQFARLSSRWRPSPRKTPSRPGG